MRDHFTSRKLQRDFILITGELVVPVSFVQGSIQYKYIVVKKGEKDCSWERLVGHDVKANRCLNIPRRTLETSGKFITTLLLKYSHILFEEI